MAKQTGAVRASVAGFLLATVLASGVPLPAHPAPASEDFSASLASSQGQTGSQGSEVEFTSDGRLKFPSEYREWRYLSSGLDMSYSERPKSGGQSRFDNVFASPEAYRGFTQSGTWPDGTVLVLEIRGAAGRGSINQSGKFQSGGRIDMEAHVKDTKRFPGGWGFFSFGGGTKPARQIPISADCYTCHRQHGAVDTTFVQFYPTLLDIAREHKTAR